MRNVFLHFQKWNPALFSLSLKNKNKTHSEKISYTSENENHEKTSHIL